MRFMSVILSLKLLVFSQNAIAAERPVVIELFTSQGCSSCPPADRLLGELAERDDLIALAYHIDYWDYIGWKDPLGLKAATLRQRAYAKSMHSRQIFTPQLIVDGTVSVVGSDEGAVTAAIKEAQRAARNQPQAIAIGLRPDGGDLILNLPASPGVGAASIWLVAFDDRHVTDIPRGENSGRTLVDIHAVRAITNLGPWRGASASQRIPSSSWPPSSDNIAILVQADGHGAIVAAQKLRLRAIP